jgi:hypothetical protein
MKLSHDVEIHFRDGSEGNRALTPHEGMWLDAIHEDLMRVLGENAVACSTITKYVRSEKFPDKNDEPPSQARTVEPDLVDQVILIALPDDPFSSVRELSRLTCLPQSTVHGAQVPD